MNQSIQQFSPEKARQARVLMGLTQKQVAEDLREKSGGLLKITNTRLSRFEKGDIALDDQTKGYLETYLNNKLVEFNYDEETRQHDNKASTGDSITDDSGSDNYEDEHQRADVQAVDVDEETTVTDETGEAVEQQAAETPKAKKLDISDLLRFDPKLNELTKDVLMKQFIGLTEQLEDALAEPVKSGWFGVSDESRDDARACVYTMAGLYNILRALQGKAILPIQDEPENILPDDDVLSLVQSSWYSFTGQGPSTIEDKA